MLQSLRSRLRAGVILAGLVTAAALPAQAETQARRPVVEVTFVLDTTGSMEMLIDGAKQKIWSIANTIVDTNPDAEIRMALIGYRDRGDEYVTQVHPMTSDIQDLYGDLMRFRADGGGDTPESVNEALHKAVHDISWTPGQGTRRIIFLVGDAPPHMDYENAPKYPEVIKAAGEKGIVVNAVQAGDDGQTRQIWKDIAQRGHGNYIPIPQDGGQIVVLESPYDDEILLLQRELDTTILPYGDAEQRRKLRSKVETRAEAPAAVQIDNSSFYSKRAKAAKEVVTGLGDLIGDIENGRQRLDKVPAGALPESLRGKSMEEQKAAVATMLGKRREIQEKISALVQKRDAFVAEARLKRPDSPKDSFDGVVQETLRSQLK